MEDVKIYRKQYQIRSEIVTQTLQKQKKLTCGARQIVLQASLFIDINHTEGIQKLLIIETTILLEFEAPKN